MSYTANASYWNARAQACKGYADEGACLARVARHVPITIVPGGGVGGLGQTDASTIASIADITARLLRDPEGTMRTQGPRIVAALDAHIVGPVADAAAARIAPYVVRYVVPSMAVLYLLSGLSTFYSYQVLKAMAGKKGIAANRRRARRLRRRR